MNDGTSFAPGTRRTDMPQRVQFKCECGRFHWVLQPHADGPFKSFPWPGTAAMHRFQQEQTSDLNASVAK